MIPMKFEQSLSLVPVIGHFVPVRISGAAIGRLPVGKKGQTRSPMYAAWKRSQGCCPMKSTNP